MTVTKRFLLLTTVALCCTAVAFPQSGVDNSTANGVFQMEGDATRTQTICFLPLASGGPAIATAGNYPPGGTTCPTVNPAGTAATWTLVNYGANTDDWSSFAFSNSNNVPHFSSKANSLFTPAFVQDAVSSGSDNTFLGSSSKDTMDITQWTWNPHGTQDKDDIEHAYAGAYKLANSDTAIYAGMDRFANSGDSTAGFWFVQDSTFALCTGVGLAASPTGSGNVANLACTGSGTFVGKHFDGDLLVVSDFSQGGAVSTINVFVWQGGSLVLDLTRSPAPCDPVAGGNNLCGLVNNAFTQVLDRRGNPVLAAATVATGGWSFTDKVGAQAYRTGESLEIAVDLNAIFGANIPCFSTFFSETRSSTSPTASLSDLTTPVSFPLCSVSASKTCTGSSIVNGNQIKYNFSGTVNNTGSSTLYNATVYDTYPAGASSQVLNQPVGSIAGGGSASYTGSFISSAILGTNDKNLISVAASSSSSGTPLNVVCGASTPTSTDNCADWGDPTTGSCPPTINAGLAITKKCQTCLTGSTDAHVQVGEAFKVCNTSNVNVTGITVQDCKGTISGQPGSQTCSTGSLTQLGASFDLGAATDATHPTCKDLFTTYNASSPAATYSDQVIASGTGALGAGTIYANGGAAYSASCDVCPVNLTCATSSTLKASCPNGLTCP